MILYDHNAHFDRVLRKSNPSEQLSGERITTLPILFNDKNETPIACFIK